MTIKNIFQLVKRIERLEKAVFSNEKKNTKTSNRNMNYRMTLTKHILALREKDYFKQPKISAEVHAKIEVSYPCAFNRVEVALIRLQKRRMLRKTFKSINKRRLTAYVW